MDACDEVMSAVNKPSGLIRYASENAIAAGTKKLFNPRVLGYSLVLSVILTILSYLLVTRPSCESIILLAKGQLLTENKGYYSNLYTIQTVNKTFSPRNLHVEVIGTPGAIIRMVGAPMNIPPDGIFQGAFFIDIPKGIYRRPAMDVTIVVIENGKIIEKVKSSFNGPQ
jgi:polyferredoxin